MLLPQPCHCHLARSLGVSSATVTFHRGSTVLSVPELAVLAWREEKSGKKSPAAAGRAPLLRARSSYLAEQSLLRRVHKISAIGDMERQHGLVFKEGIESRAGRKDWAEAGEEAFAVVGRVLSRHPDVTAIKGGQ